MPDGTHDIDIWTADGRHVAIEVGRVTVPGLREQVQAESGWHTRKLKLHWTVSLRDDRVKVKGKRERFEEELGALEELLGPVPTDDRAAQPAVWLDAVPPGLAALGVAAVGYFPRHPEFTEVAHVMLRAWQPRSSRMEDAFADVLAQVDANREKLMRSSAHERHVFVFIESWHWASQAWWFSDAVPSAPLTLPEGIDAVWVAPATFDQKEYAGTDRVWRFQPADGWRLFDDSLTFRRALNIRFHERLGPSPVESDNVETRRLLQRIGEVMTD